MLMAADDINFQNNIDIKLRGIAKGVGIEFTEDVGSKRQSNNFREQMKQKQKERGVNSNGR